MKLLELLDGGSKSDLAQVAQVNPELPESPELVLSGLKSPGPTWTDFGHLSA